VCVVIVLGCTKKKTEDTAPSGGGSGGGGGTPEPPPPGQTYTITLRPQRAGGQKAGVERPKGTNTKTKRGGERKGTEKETETERIEYTETIIELPAGTDRPTKFTRNYKVAEEGEGDGPAMPLSCVGKTIFFDKRDDGAYAITSNGKPLPPDEEK